VTRRVLLALALLVLLLPLAWTLLAALGLEANDNTRPPTWNGALTFDHVLEVGTAEPAFWEELVTSTVSAACATALTVLVSLLAAYGLARSGFRGRQVVVQSFLVLASLPAMAYVIPLSDLMRRAALADSLVGVVLTEAAVSTPLAIYVLHGALSQLAPEFEEAAWLDGAGVLQVVARVVLPAAAPAVSATALVLFVIDWNLLLVPLVLTSGEIKTVPVAMSDFFTFERELEWPTAAAALMVSLLPVAVLVAVFHRVLDRFALNVGPQA
jgi:multiple sugar transport system permease protein